MGKSDPPFEKIEAHLPDAIERVCRKYPRFRKPDGGAIDSKFVDDLIWAVARWMAVTPDWRSFP